MTVASALSGNGLAAALELEGAPDAPGFAWYIDQVLGPPRGPGAGVVPDTLPVQKVAGLRERRQVGGARVR